MIKPIVIQCGLLYLDVHSEAFEEAQAAIGSLAILVRRLEHFHLYRLDKDALHRSILAGLTPSDIEAFFARYSRYEVPQEMLFIIRDTMTKKKKTLLDT
jgi:DNA excision repair protein ERCC-3